MMKPMLPHNARIPALLLLLAVAVGALPAGSVSAASSGYDTRPDAAHPASSRPAASQPAATAPTEGLLKRVVLIGASATHGYGATIAVDLPESAGKFARTVAAPVSLCDALDATLLAPHDRMLAHATPYFFATPMDTGPQQVRRALLRKPTLVVALDFLFWFGYGDGNCQGRPITSEDDRLALLEEGLKLVGQFECPVIVGDFGDLSPAVGGMLTRQQMPELPTLDRLNARLREFAKDHPNIMIAPMAQVIGQMRADTGFAIGGVHYPPGAGASLIQSDKLHPTAQGLVGLAQLIADVLATSGRIDDAGAFDHDPKDVLEKMRQRALEKLQAKTAK